MTRVPLVIHDPKSGDTKHFYRSHSENPHMLVYQSVHNRVRTSLNPWEVETDFVTDRVRPATEVVRQGKFECAAASLALLLGHSLFNVQSAMGLHGWRNDDRGACDKVMRHAAREFGRDLVYAGRRTVDMMGLDLPSCTVTVRSLNVLNMNHSVTWINGEIVDPNFGHPTRNYWSSRWAPWTMNVANVLILAKRPLTEKEHKDLEWVRTSGTRSEVVGELSKVAA